MREKSELTFIGRSGGSEIQLDQLLMKFRPFFTQVPNNVLQIIDTNFRPDRIEMSHDNVARQGFHLFEIGNEDLFAIPFLVSSRPLPARVREATRAWVKKPPTHLETGPFVLLEDPFRSWQNHVDVIGT